MLVQRRRDTRAALRLMRKLLRKQGFALKLLVTDKLRQVRTSEPSLLMTLRWRIGDSNSRSPPRRRG
jgi:transposase-like protein